MFRRRRQGDWVFRPNFLDPEGAILTNDGSYANDEQVLDAGVGASGGCILYDSHNFANTNRLGIDNVLGFDITQAASSRAEGARSVLIERVQGSILWRPSSWAVGNDFHLGLRFGIWEQDPDSGSLFVNPSYTLWESVAGGGTGDLAAMHANSGQWQREHRINEYFVENNNRFSLNVNFPVRRRLRPNEAYALWAQTKLGSVRLFLQFWLRTYVVDDET